MKPKLTIILNKKVSEVSDSCPTATVDIEENKCDDNHPNGQFIFEATVMAAKIIILII